MWSMLILDWISRSHGSEPFWRPSGDETTERACGWWVFMARKPPSLGCAVGSSAVVLHLDEEQQGHLLVRSLGELLRYQQQ